MEVSSYDDQDQILRYMDECSKVLFLELSLSTCIDNNCKISIFIPIKSCWNESRLGIWFSFDLNIWIHIYIYIIYYKRILLLPKFVECQCLYWQIRILGGPPEQPSWWVEWHLFCDNWYLWLTNMLTIKTATRFMNSLCTWTYLVADYW